MATSSTTRPATRSTTNLTTISGYDKINDKIHDKIDDKINDKIADKVNDIYFIHCHYKGGGRWPPPQKRCRGLTAAAPLLWFPL